MEAYGDVSSERALVRALNLSCIKGKDIIDQEIDGHVSFMGKNGIKGEVVIRSGKILMYAWGPVSLTVLDLVSAPQHNRLSDWGDGQCWCRR